MIDWLWMRVPCRSALHVKTPRIACISAEGAVEWESPRWLKSRGSHDTTMAVRPAGDILELSGSPAKFLQGHNCFGSDDVHALSAFVIARCCDALEIPLHDDEVVNIAQGETDLLRVDINYSYSTGSRSNALAWIRGAEQHGTLQHRGRGMMYGSTVQFGKRSRYWSLKAYCKGQELEARDHGLPVDLPHRAELLAWADDKLRPEVTLHARQLREYGLDKVKHWTADKVRDIFVAHLAKLSLSGHLTMTEEAIRSMPPGLQGALAMWKAGTDLRATLNRRTFYKYRKQLLDLAGVDIAVAPVNERANVVPLVRVIEAVPASIPEWAVGTSLYWQPPERRRA